MAGPIPLRWANSMPTEWEAFMPRRITKVGEHSNPVIRSFIASFGVAPIKIDRHNLSFDIWSGLFLYIILKEGYK